MPSVLLRRQYAQHTLCLQLALVCHPCRTELLGVSLVQGDLWVLAVTAHGASQLYKLEGGIFQLRHDSDAAGIALCDVDFDVFGYLYAVGYAPADAANSCSAGTAIFKSAVQVGSEKQRQQQPVELQVVFGAGELGPARPLALAAGPHSATANFRGSNAMLLWTVSSPSPLRFSETVYAPNFSNMEPTAW